MAARCVPAIRANYQHGIIWRWSYNCKEIKSWKESYSTFYLCIKRSESRDARTKWRCRIFARFPNGHPPIPTPLCRNIRIVRYADVVRRPTESVLSLFYTCYDRRCFQSSPLTIVNLVRDRWRNILRWKEERTRRTNSKSVWQVSSKVVADVPATFVRTDSVTWINGEGGYDPREKKITDLQDG